MTISLHQRIIFSVLIFAIIMLLLGIPYTDWWLNGPDDFHALYICNKTNTWKDLFYFFYNGHTNQGQLDENFIPSTGRTPFFGTYYRPLHLIVLTLQYWIFGTNTYGYFLINVFFHALNAVMLFNIFLWLIPVFPSLLATVFFAFHPQIAYRFGAIVNIQYYVNLTLILLTMLCFKKYLDSKKIMYNILACWFFIFSLFMREVTIVMPGIIFLGAYLYEKTVLKLPHINFLQQWWHYLKYTSGLVISAFLYLSLRLYLYPLATTSHSSVAFNLKHYLQAQFSSFVVFAYDFLGLSWLPWGHKVMRGFFMITLSSLLILFFIRNTKKIYVLYFLLCIALLLWPAYVGPYSPRYIYEVLPFIIAAIICCLTFQKYNIKTFKFAGFSCLSAAMLFFIVFTVESFSRRETKQAIASKAVHELMQDPRIHNKKLCFFGTPNDGLGPMFTQLVWVLLHNNALPVYFDETTAITQLDSNIVTPTKWCNIVSEYYHNNFMTITPVKDGFTFTSLNPQKVAFPQKQTSYSLGKKTIHKKETINGEELVTAFTLHLDQKYLHDDTLFIAWDYKDKKFKFLHLAHA